VRDAQDAARRGDAGDFEHHMHEVQDYFSHRGRNITPAKHVMRNLTRRSPDDPTRKENRSWYDMADRTTRFLEDYWDKFNPAEQEVPKEKKAA
jgi:hypothetical protein